MHRARTLSPRDLADALGVSESSVKRWIDAGHIAATRTGGGHRRIALEDALSFIRRRGLAVRHPEGLGLGPRGDGAPPLPAAALLAALEAADAPLVRSLLTEAHLAGTPLPTLFDGPVREAVASLGKRWHEDFDRGVATEHGAMAALQEALAVLRSLVPPPPGAPVAVGGAASCDPYAVPSMMASIVLSEGGWEAVNLGPNLPLSALALAAEERDARLVWFSCSVPPEEDMARDLAVLAERLRHRGGTVVVGGRASEGLQEVPGVRVGATMQALAEMARGLHR